MNNTIEQIRLYNLKKQSKYNNIYHYYICIVSSCDNIISNNDFNFTEKKENIKFIFNYFEKKIKQLEKYNFNNFETTETIQLYFNLYDKLINYINDISFSILNS